MVSRNGALGLELRIPGLKTAVKGTNWRNTDRFVRDENPGALCWLGTLPVTNDSCRLTLLLDLDRVPVRTAENEFWERKSDRCVAGGIENGSRRTRPTAPMLHTSVTEGLLVAVVNGESDRLRWDQVTCEVHMNRRRSGQGSRSRGRSWTHQWGRAGAGWRRLSWTWRARPGFPSLSSYWEPEYIPSALSHGESRRGQRKCPRRTSQGSQRDTGPSWSAWWGSGSW